MPPLTPFAFNQKYLVNYDATKFLDKIEEQYHTSYENPYARSLQDMILEVAEDGSFVRPQEGQLSKDGLLQGMRQGKTYILPTMDQYDKLNYNDPLVLASGAMTLYAMKRSDANKILEEMPVKPSFWDRFQDFFSFLTGKRNLNCQAWELAQEAYAGIRDVVQRVRSAAYVADTYTFDKEGIFADAEQRAQEQTKHIEEEQQREEEARLLAEEARIREEEMLRAEGYKANADRINGLRENSSLSLKQSDEEFLTALQNMHALGKDPLTKRQEQLGTNLSKQDIMERAMFKPIDSFLMEIRTRNSDPQFVAQQKAVFIAVYRSIEKYIDEKLDQKLVEEALQYNGAGNTEAKQAVERLEDFSDNLLNNYNNQVTQRNKYADVGGIGNIVVNLEQYTSQKQNETQPDDIRRRQNAEDERLLQERYGFLVELEQKDELSENNGISHDGLQDQVLENRYENDFPANVSENDFPEESDTELYARMSMNGGESSLPGNEGQEQTNLWGNGFGPDGNPVNPFDTNPYGGDRQSEANNPFSVNPYGEPASNNPFSVNPYGEPVSNDPFSVNPYGESVSNDPFSVNPFGDENKPEENAPTKKSGPVLQG